MDDREGGKRSLLDAGRGPATPKAKADDSGWPGKVSLTQQIKGSGGQALPTSIRGDLQQDLGGEDLSGVNVHTDGAAASAAQGLSARAFTVGQSIYFGAGQYDPGSSSGQSLIAHEVAHTVQQRGVSGTPQLAALDVSTPGDAHEVEAEAFGASFAERRSAGARGPAPRVAPVSRAVISRALIQRDLLPGGIPLAGTLKFDVGSLGAAKVDPDDVRQGVLRGIREARARGPAAVLGKAEELRAHSTDETHVVLEQSLDSELTDDEKAGGSPAAKPASEPAATAKPKTLPATQGANQPEHKTDVAEQKHGTSQPANHPANGDQSGKQVAKVPGGGSQKATDPLGDKPGEGAAKAGGEADKGGGKGATADGKKSGAKAKPKASANGGGATPLGLQAVKPEPDAPPPPAGAQREFIEQELAFHENWAALSGGPAARAKHLMSTLGTDAAAATFNSEGFWMSKAKGLLVPLAIAKTPLNKIPGVGQMFGAWGAGTALFSNGGAGLLESGKTIGTGFTGLSSLVTEGFSFGAMADLLAGIHSLVELIGNVASIVSGLAYAFAAIGALGAMLSFLFPPLAMLVPYIPMAINLGKTASSISTVCGGVAMLLSPLPAIMRALHIVFSQDDPIKLVAQEKTYHAETQRWISDYSEAITSKVTDKVKTVATQKFTDYRRSSRGLPPVAQPKSAPMTTPKPTEGGTWNNLKTKTGSAAKWVVLDLTDIREGVTGYKEARGGRQEATRLRDDLKGEGQGVRSEVGQSYFDPTRPREGRAEQLSQGVQRADALIAELEKGGPANAEKLARAKALRETLDQRSIAVDGLNPERKEQLLTGQKRAADLKASIQAEGGPGSDAKVEKLTAIEGQIGSNFTDEKRTNDLIVRQKKSMGETKAEFGDVKDGWKELSDADKDAAEAREEREKQQRLQDVENQAGTGGSAPEAPAPKNSAGHVQLPAPPGSLKSVDSLDAKIAELRSALPQQKSMTAQAKHARDQAKQQGKGVMSVRSQMTKKVAAQKARADAEHQAIAAQDAHLQQTTADVAGKSSGGTQKVSGPLASIASVAHKVDGFLQGVPSNKFFNISSAKSGVHKFAEGIDLIIGAPGGQSEAKGKTDTAIAGRKAAAVEAKGSHESAKSTADQLAARMSKDKGTADQAGQQAAGVAGQSANEEKTMAQQLAEATAERKRKFDELAQWASTHAQLRHQVDPGDAG